MEATSNSLISTEFSNLHDFEDLARPPRTKDDPCLREQNPSLSKHPTANTSLPEQIWCQKGDFTSKSTLKITAAITIDAFYPSRWKSTLEENVNICTQM